jgi:C4-dicarboxylate transporter DctQ subunit
MKNLVHKIEEVVSAIVLAFMTILTFANVVSRYLLKGSISFTDELTTLLFVLLTMLGSAIAARKGSHLGLTVITDIIPEKYHKWVYLFIGICSFVFCVLVIYFGII